MITLKKDGAVTAESRALIIGCAGFLLLGVVALLLVGREAVALSGRDSAGDTDALASSVPGPQSKTRPPLPGLGALERPRLHRALTAAADAHRLTVVAAPAGYGKTTFLGDWARDCDLPCA